jgi:hypothetical protein
MKSIRELVFLLALAVAMAGAQPVFATPTCTGKFANPITDICWSCMLPIRFGGLDLVSMGQEDTPNVHGKLPPLIMKPAMPVSPYPIFPPQAGERANESLREFYVKPGGSPICTGVRLA